ncbi:MAG: GGDEF domain-containing phosphodiesterase, partial [Pseudomonadota bacterium]
QTENQLIRPGVSVGVAEVDICRPHFKDPDLQAIMRLADYALYHSKRAGRGRVTLADTPIVSRFVEYRAIVEELRRASHSNSLAIFLQPKFELDGLNACGFEALVRWRRGDRLVQPDEFIEIAEENGLISEIDHWVLDQAVRLIHDYNQQNGTEYGINVNISSVNLGSYLIVNVVKDVLKSAGLPAGLLTLEINEGALSLHRGNAEAVIGELRALGVRLAVDDFGSGQAPFVSIRQLRPDELKIDRCLVADIATSEEARFVLERVISLGIGLGIDVVVEGVETQAEAQLVSAMGCKLGQGFFWGLPEPASQALERASRGHIRISEEREARQDAEWEDVARGQERDPIDGERIRRKLS